MWWTAGLSYLMTWGLWINCDMNSPTKSTTSHSNAVLPPRSEYSFSQRICCKAIPNLFKTSLTSKKLKRLGLPTLGGGKENTTAPRGELGPILLLDRSGMYHPWSPPVENNYITVINQIKKNSLGFFLLGNLENGHWTFSPYVLNIIACKTCMKPTD